MGILDGRVAVVTGAAQGQKASLGSLFAKHLAQEGATVVLADRQDCALVAAEISAAGGTAISVMADLSQEADVRHLFDQAVGAYGRLDILVNNAAVGSNIPPVPLADLDVGTWDQAMEVNVRGTFLCSKHAAPIMARNRYGKIVNIGSTTSREGLAQRLHYVVAKGAIETMTRALARELGASGIRVNTLAPGLVMSRAIEQAMAARPGLHQAVLSARSIPEDVAGADLLATLAYLCSPASDAVNGQYIAIDNGSYFT
jgi:NAD(P)-dependent dehydrogenase (short-subunit alcohol dehydrogenase family)